MADNEQEIQDLAGEGHPAGQSEGEDQPGGGGLREMFRGRRLFLLLGFPATGVLAALVAALMLFSGDGDSQPEQPQTTPAPDRSAPALISTSRAMEMAEQRSALRRSNRSSYNQHLTEPLGPDDLYRITVRGELALLAGMFDHYVEATAKFYELFRVMANQYVQRDDQLLALFENQLLPDYRATERRRRTLRRRVEHDPAIELYNQLDYIAYHDSIAVNSFHEFLTEGGPEKFTTTAELVNESKFMIRDFRDQMQQRLDEFDVDYLIPEELWTRYYGSWPW